MSFRNLVNHFLAESRYRIEKVSPQFNKFQSSRLQINLDYIFAHHYLNTENFFLIQVGANDGKRYDPIHHLIQKYELNGILIEPLKDMYDDLCKTYQEYPNLEKINVALHSSFKELELYRIARDTPELPDTLNGIASFQKQHIFECTKNFPVARKFIQKELVKAISFEELVLEKNISKIDLLQIDCEGYDFEIIKMINFSKLKPQIIHYEHDHLSETDNFECLKLLTEQGYMIFPEKNDVIAYLS